MQCYRRSRVIRIMSTPWPSRRMGRRWRRHRTTTRSSCGTPGQARCGRRSRAIRIMSTPWPSRRTAGRWCRHQTMRWSSCGTLGQAHCGRRSRSPVLSTHTLFLMTVPVFKLIEDSYLSYPFRLPALSIHINSLPTPSLLRNKGYIT
jgi:hypothetical protein